VSTLLLVDVGNTRIKGALARDGVLTALPALVTRAADFSPWREPCAAARPARLLLSNVGGEAVTAALHTALGGLCAGGIERARVHDALAGLRTRYREPHRLGVDRWLVALAAWLEVGGPVCVVDVGTALTVDIVDGDGEHWGGLIAPGPELMRRSLTEGTAHLTADTITPIAGFADNTHDAIALGCGEATRGLLRCVEERLAVAAPGIDVAWYLTGGGAATVRALHARPWREVPDLVLRGLARYAEHCP